MSRSRWLKLPCLGLLAAGLFALAASDDILAASKPDEVKKYTTELRTAKDVKIKIIALTEIGKAALIDKELVQPALKDIVAALGDKDAGVRGAAAHAYGQASRATEDQKAVLTTLVKMMKEDPDETAKDGAIKGLASMRDAASPAVGDLRKLQQEEIERAKKDPKNAKNNNPQTKLSRAANDAIRAIGNRN